MPWLHMKRLSLSMGKRATRTTANMKERTELTTPAWSGWMETKVGILFFYQPLYRKLVGVDFVHTCESPDDEIFGNGAPVRPVSESLQSFAIISGSDRNFLAQYVVKIVEGEFRGKYRCSICGLS